MNDILWLYLLLEDQLSVLAGDLEDLVFLGLDTAERQRQQGADGRLGRDQVVEAGVDDLGSVHFLDWVHTYSGENADMYSL